MSDDLRAIASLSQGVLDVRTGPLPLIELLERETARLQEGHRARRPAAAALLRIHAPDESILADELSLEQAHAAIAAYHRFASWSDVVARGGDPVDPRFEAAADAIVAGDAAALRALVAQQPALVHARSPFRHRATLLHHVAANGVEESRQWQSPPNAVEIARILLDAGADPDATCPCYGPADTPLYLLVTSGFPAAAGTQADLVEVLCRAGANPNGREDDGWPFWEAIKFEYAPAAERLARCGARVDNLVFAAAVGDLPAVRAYLDDAGRLRPGLDWGAARAAARELDVDHLLEYALIFAAAHGRREVVELLLTQQPDLGVREPFWKATALEAARWHKRADIVALLEPLR